MLPFESEESLVAFGTNGTIVPMFLAGIIFTKLDDPLNITYKIRLSARLRNSGAAYD